MNQPETDLAVEVVEAAVDTVENPSIPNLVRDMELAIRLVKEFKAAIAKLHPHALSFIKKAL